MPAPESAIFDRDLQLAFRRRAFRRAEPGADFLLRRVAEDLADRLDAVERRFPVAIDLAGHSGLAAEAIAFSGKADTILRVERDTDFLKGPYPAVVGDEELLPIKPGSADLIVSLMALHSTNDTPGAMVQIARALKPDGLFLAALSGSGTLGELRESLLQAEIELTGGASPRVFPFADVRDVGGLLQRAGFALPVTGVCGFDQAQVTAGGLCTDEFDPETMKSRLVSGLYACGELLDVDGDCGGFNLQWAWASGRLAGRLR